MSLLRELEFIRQLAEGIFAVALARRRAVGAGSVRTFAVSAFGCKADIAIALRNKDRAKQRSGGELGHGMSHRRGFIRQVMTGTAMT